MLKTAPCMIILLSLPFVSPFELPQVVMERPIMIVRANAMLPLSCVPPVLLPGNFVG